MSRKKKWFAGLEYMNVKPITPLVSCRVKERFSAWPACHVSSHLGADSAITVYGAELYEHCWPAAVYNVSATNESVII